MLQFRVYFSDGFTQVVKADSATQARKVAGDLAKRNGVFVMKVKVNRC